MGIFNFFKKDEQKDDATSNEIVNESLFNFWEFVGDEYPGGAGGIMNDCRELGISIQDFDAMDKSYREKGVICIQEKDTIIEMIRLIKKHLDKDNNFDKIEFLKANYESPEQWAESTIKAHSHHEPIKEEYLERLKNCKTWDDVLVLSEEVVPFLTRWLFQLGTDNTYDEKGSIEKTFITIEIVMDNV